MIYEKLARIVLEDSLGKQEAKLYDTDRNRRLYALLGGRSGRVRLARDAETGEYIQTIDDGNSSPLLEIVYTFFKDPTSSPPAKMWARVMGLIAVLRVLTMACETVDGPQFYEGRQTNNATFTWMPNHSVYYALYLAFCIPLLVDALTRLLVICLMLTDYEGESTRTFRADGLDQFLTACNILSVVPFIVGLFLFPRTYSYTVALLQPPINSKTGLADLSEYIAAEAVLNYTNAQAGLVLLRLLNLLVSAHVMRLCKHLTVVRTVTLAIKRAAPNLVLPIFFFVVFNIIAGVVFYFAEPCYDLYACPWPDLFQSTFFSIVTMTTVGYGNQVPYTDLTRMVAVFMMLFGALFISMPLALIGNEYTDAVIELEDQRIAEHAEWAARVKAVDNDQPKDMHKIAVSKLGKLTHTNDGDGDDPTGDDCTTEQLEINNTNKSTMVQYFTKIHVCAALLEEELNNIELQWQKDKSQPEWIKRKNPTGLMSTRAILLQAETMSAIPALMGAIKVATVGIVRITQETKKDEEQKEKENDSKEGKRGNDTKLGEGKDPGSKLTVDELKSRLLQRKGKHRKESESALSVRSDGEEEEGFSDTDDEEEEEDDDTDEDEAQHTDILIGNDLSTSDAFGTDYIKTMQARISVGPINGNKIAPLPFSTSMKVNGTSRPKKKVNRSSFYSAVSSQKNENKKQRMEKKRSSFFQNLVGGVFFRGRDRGTLRIRSQNRESSFNQKLRHVLLNPRTLKSRIWMLLELPHSSHQAYYYRYVMIGFICLSIFCFFFETMQYFNSYGPNTKICGSVLEQYCSGKPVDSDPGCFVQSAAGPTNIPLSYVNNRYRQEPVVYDSTLSPSNTAFELYSFDAFDTKNTWQDMFHQPETAESVLNAHRTMMKICYKTHFDKFNSTISSFPLLPIDIPNGVMGYTYTMADDTSLSVQYPLNECHRFGFNFGTSLQKTVTRTTVINPVNASDGIVMYEAKIPLSRYSCESDSDGNLLDPASKGFQDLNQLEYTYRPLTTFTSREEVHARMPICHRIECAGTEATVDGSFFLPILEILCFSVFLLDFLVRYLISDSLLQFFGDIVCIMDFCALLPFMILVWQQSQTYPFPDVWLVGARDIDFKILSSSPGPFFTTISRVSAVMRVLRVTHQFTVTQVLVDTARKCFRQILGMEAFFLLVLIFFTLILFELEGGKACFVAPSVQDALDDNMKNEYNYCQTIPDSVAQTVHIGDRLVIDKNGDISWFSTSVECLWFSFVTSTTTGYGDKWPITNGGMFVNLFLMLAGSMYLAMPLSVVAGTYYAAHQKYLQTKKKAQNIQKLTTNGVAAFNADTFTSDFQLKLQNLYDVLKAELFIMNSLTNHLRRDYQSYLRFGLPPKAELTTADLDKKKKEKALYADSRKKKKKQDQLKEFDESESDEEEPSDSDEDEVDDSKPPLTEALDQSLFRLQQVLDQSKEDLYHLATLDCRRVSYLDNIEVWRQYDTK